MVKPLTDDPKYRSKMRRYNTWRKNLSASAKRRYRKTPKTKEKYPPNIDIGGGLIFIPRNGAIIFGGAYIKNAGLIQIGSPRSIWGRFKCLVDIIRFLIKII